MPSQTERDSIVSRVEHLERDLAPATYDQIIEVVAALFVSTPQQSTSPEVMRGRYGVFYEALHDLPFWALEAAAKRWMRGEAKGNPAFSPSSGELRRLAVEETAPHRMMIERLKRVLTAKPIMQAEHTPESRERVAKGLGALAATLAKQSEEAR